MMDCLALLVLGQTSPAYESDELLFPHCQAWRQKLVGVGAPEYSWGFLGTVLKHERVISPISGPAPDCYWKVRVAQKSALLVSSQLCQC